MTEKEGPNIPQKLRNQAELKITVRKHGDTTAHVWLVLDEGTLADYSFDTGDIELTVDLIKVIIREKSSIRNDGV